MTDRSPVTRSSMRGVVPIVAPIHMAVLPGRIWSDDEWERINLGYRSRDMDEKWDVFVEGQVAYLHRRWTGHGIFEATFSPAGGGWCISAAVIESEPDRVSSKPERRDRVMLELVLASTVLGEPAAGLRAELAALIAQESGRADVPAGAVLHSMLGLRTD